MASNLDRFKRDLEKLILKGDRLELAIRYDVSKEQFINQLKKQEEDPQEFIKKLPNFHREYESWYSESLALLRQLLPDRVTNFVTFYEKPKNRKAISYGDYFIQDYLQGLVVKGAFGEIKVDTSAALPQFRQQLNILRAAEDRFESSLFEIKQIVQADLFDCELQAGRELLKNKFTRAAGAIAGVILEKHLTLVCNERKIKIIKKNPGINDLNELLKENSVIEVAQWRYISFLGDIRNLCDHNKKVEPTLDQVKDLIDGTEKILKTIF